MSERNGHVVIGIDARAFNATIRRRRRELGLTQGQLAEKAGVSKGTVSQLETLKNPRLSPGKRRVLGVLGLGENASPEWLAALNLYGTRTIEQSVTADLVAAPERLGLPMHANSDEAADPAESVLARAGVDDLRAALKHIPRRERDVLELRYIHEWPWEDVARHLGVTRERALQIRGTAFQRLRDYLPLASGR